MGRRSRQRGKVDKLEAPTTDYTSSDGEQALTLRGALSPKSGAEYTRASDPSQARAAANVEDVRARAIEFLFERLDAKWTVNDVPTEGAQARLGGYRAATRGTRRGAARRCGRATARRRATSAGGSPTCCASTATSGSRTSRCRRRGPVTSRR